MLISPEAKIGSHSENKFLMPLLPIRKNYPKIIINNGPGSAPAAEVKENIGDKAMLQLTLALIKH